MLLTRARRIRSDECTRGPTVGDQRTGMLVIIVTRAHSSLPHCDRCRLLVTACGNSDVVVQS